MSKIGKKETYKTRKGEGKMIEESLLKNIKLNTEFKVDLDLKNNKKTKETK